MDVIKKLDSRHSLCRCMECSNSYKVKHSPSDINHISHLCDMCSSITNQPMTQELAIKFFNYDEESGLLSWRLPTSKAKVGSPVGSNCDTGYLRIKVGSKHYAIHRLIWLMKTGKFPDQIDHIDHVRSNNVWANLREVTQTENMYNKGKYKNNTTGVVGVCYETRCSKFRAYIKIPSGNKHLGYFDTIEEATTARKAAEVQYGYHINHGQ